ncbi:hypothetical protein ABZP36_017371 [Zizania latifolia]
MSRASGSRPPPGGSGGRLAVLASHFSQSSHPASEKEAALAADPSDGSTIFDNFVERDLISVGLRIKGGTLAFRDISPQAPVHIITIPKVKDGLSRLSKQDDLDDGFRIIIEGLTDVSLYITYIFIFSGDVR